MVSGYYTNVHVLFRSLEFHFSHMLKCLWIAVITEYFIYSNWCKVFFWNWIFFSVISVLFWQIFCGFEHHRFTRTSSIQEKKRSRPNVTNDTWTYRNFWNWFIYDFVRYYNSQVISERNMAARLQHQHSIWNQAQINFKVMKNACLSLLMKC